MVATTFPGELSGPVRVPYMLVLTSCEDVRNSDPPPDFLMQSRTLRPGCARGHRGDSKVLTPSRKINLVSRICVKRSTEHLYTTRVPRHRTVSTRCILDQSNSAVVGGERFDRRYRSALTLALCSAEAAAASALSARARNCPTTLSTSPFMASRRLRVSRRSVSSRQRAVCSWWPSLAALSVWPGPRPRCRGGGGASSSDASPCDPNASWSSLRLRLWNDDSSLEEDGSAMVARTVLNIFSRARESIPLTSQPPPLPLPPQDNGESNEDDVCPNRSAKIVLFAPSLALPVEEALRSSPGLILASDNGGGGG